MWHCRLHPCGTENKKSCSFSTSGTVHLFLCFAPQMAQLGFFIELSFSHKLYDFPTTLCRKRESNLCRQICTSLRDLDSRRLQMLSTTAVVDKRTFPVQSLTKCSHLLFVFLQIHSGFRLWRPSKVFFLSKYPTSLARNARFEPTHGQVASLR